MVHLVTCRANQHHRCGHSNNEHDGAFQRILARAGFNSVQVGVVWGIGALPSIIRSLMGGVIGDQIGPKTVMVFGSLLPGLLGAGVPVLGCSASGTSKASSMRMTDSPAFELQREGFDSIQVYGLSPGFVSSGISKGVASSPLGRKWLPYVKEWINTGQHHPAEDVDDAIVELCRSFHPYLKKGFLLRGRL